MKTISFDILANKEIELGKLIQSKLGRDLRPYDIWYNGFKAQSSLSEAELNKITQKKFILLIFFFLKFLWAVILFYKILE